MAGRKTAILVVLLLAGCTAGLQDDAGNDIVATYATLDPQAKALYYTQSEQLSKPVHPRLVELDQKTIGCFGPRRVQGMDPAGENLGGQCCGALTSHEAYELQLEALHGFIEENGDVGYVPRDPYDVPVAQAQELTAWDAVVLTPEQQSVYDAALEMSHHGPCCCKCWKWYMMSGLAKRLIIEEGWSAGQVAELWDLSSSCGHDEDTDIAEHYRGGHGH